MDDAAIRLLAVSVGNTRTGFGLFEGREPSFVRAMPHAPSTAALDAILESARELDGAERTAIVVASVSPRHSAPLIEALETRAGHEVYRVGEDMPIPIGLSLDDGAEPGQDRLLAAAAAFDAVKQACVVIDAGTAVTVDFVDGVGAFHGGAILPGARMMLRALHEGAALLPELELTRPDDSEPFGRNTRDAMLNGVFYGIRGAVRMLVERYAEKYGGYPLVVATGGDARLLFADDELVERVSDDLVLRGIALTCEAALTDRGEPDEAADGAGAEVRSRPAGGASVWRGKHGRDAHATGG